jgi:hypothetical protein
MIKLIDLLFEEENQPYDVAGGDSHAPRSVWQTDVYRWAGKNSFGQVRYFRDKEPGKAKEKAEKFARGTTKGPSIGRAKAKQIPQKANRVQKYFDNPS